jgi:hypothetical protein
MLTSLTTASLTFRCALGVLINGTGTSTERPPN